MTTLKKLEELVYQGFREIKEQSQETERRFQETDRLVKELSKHITGLTDSLGRFAEHMVEPSVARLFRERGVVLTDIYSRFSERRNGAKMEVDVLAFGPDAVVAVEVKLKLELSDVSELLEKLPSFFEFFTLLRGRKLYGAIAGMSIDEGVARHAYKQGLFVLAPSDEVMQILNDEAFVPRVYAHSGEDSTRSPDPK